MSRLNNMFAFPGIPGSHASRYGIDQLRLRPFGRAPSDIDIDFQQTLRPYLVTQLLRCCTTAGTGKGHQQDKDFDPGFFWDLTLAKRIETLLVIATSGGVSSLLFQLRCSRQTCAELIEIELSMDEITGLQPPGGNTAGFCIQINGTDYFFRKPTGFDQVNWLNASFADEDDAVASMIRTLWIVPGEAAPPGHFRNREWIEAIDEGMKAADPLVHFNITVGCPVCGEKSECFIDLEEFLLQKLHKVQQRLLDEIHCLASHYHWSEEQILAILPHRRRHYLSLIDGEDKKTKKE
jgi:hypothetical protein